MPSITHITTERLSFTTGAGIRLIATSTDGQIISIPIIWTEKDFDPVNKHASGLVQSLFENGIASIMDILEGQP